MNMKISSSVLKLFGFPKTSFCFPFLKRENLKRYEVNRKSEIPPNKPKIIFETEKLLHFEYS